MINGRRMGAQTMEELIANLNRAAAMWFPQDLQLDLDTLIGAYRALKKRDEEIRQRQAPLREQERPKGEEP